jgi:hypothetical protein
MEASGRSLIEFSMTASARRDPGKLRETCQKSLSPGDILTQNFSIKGR